MIKRITLVALFLGLLPVAFEPAHQSAAGAWWNSSTSPERASFVDGFMDCFVYDAGLGKDGLNMSGDFWPKSITAFYEEHPDANETAVAVVLAKLIGRSSINPKPLDGETTVLEGKHAGYDSDYWRTRFPEERIGFIEGYLSCQKLYGKPKGVFSKPDEWYVEQISKWYGLKPGTDEIDERKASTKIADVLYRFRDGSGRE